ncbi:MAG: NAD(+) synthase [Coriobacteriia bacterium]|nr:NAD(+) synthase [Coriobacteriia bacterium]
MYIAVVQSNPTIGALRQNAEAALAAIKKLAEMPYAPDLVVLPSHALTGVNVKGLHHHDAFAAECMDATKFLIENSPLPTLFGTLIPRPLEDIHSFVCEPEVIFCSEGKGGALGFVDLENPWHSARYVSSVDIHIDDRTLTVCMNDFPDSDDDFKQADVIVMMLAKEYEGTNALFTSSTQENYLSNLAKKNDAWLVLANLVGGQDEIVYDGASLVIDSKGQVRDCAEPFAEQILVVNLELDENSGVLAEVGKTVKPLLPFEADWEALKLSLRDFVRKNEFENVVIGLSGGIDSALTAALAVEALGAEHVFGVLMPGPFSSESSVSDSKELAATLGIQTLTFPITNLFELFKNESAAQFETEGSAVALENLQARLRMLVLMHLSNTHCWLVLNTTNKSESAVGYSTLYGDTAGAFAPLGNLYKTDLYGLVAWRNAQGRVIPQSIVDKEPSAELSPDQRDADSLPPYEELDRILRLHIEDDLGIDQILEIAKQESGERALDPEVVASVLDMVSIAEFKRRQEPLAPTLGTVSMNEERNWPLGSGFKDHNRKLVPHTDVLDYLSSIYLSDGPQGMSILEN